MGKGTTKGSMTGLRTDAEAAMRPAGIESVPSGNSRPAPALATTAKNFLSEILNRDPPSSAIRRSSVAYRHVAGAARDGDLVPIRGIGVVGAIHSEPSKRAW